MELEYNKFCEQFIASFLGAWCAKHYENACICNEHERLENPPFEDAVCLAEAAWETYIKIYK